MNTIEHFAEPSDDGHGYVAIVKQGGKTVYNSNRKHGKPGVFDGESQALQHAEAWANCVRLIDERTEAVATDRKMRLAGELIVLESQEHEDRTLAGKLKTAAKTAEANADARNDRGKALARHAQRPRLRIFWDRKAPEAVKIQVEESEWDAPFIPEELDLDEDRQLSLPGTNWQISHEAGAVVRAIGHGRVELVVSEGKVTIRLGANEHTITGVLTGALEYTEALEAAPASKPAKGKASKPVETKSGKLGDKPLRERLPHLTRAETLLGIYVLEAERKKPRDRVLKALEAEATNHDDPRLLSDMDNVDEKRMLQIKPDRAAAALATASGEVAINVLEQLVPECGDAVVIGWLLDDEKERGENARDEVVTVLQQRLAELAPKVPAADGEVEDDGPQQLALEPAEDGRPVVH